MLTTINRRMILTTCVLLILNGIRVSAIISAAADADADALATAKEKAGEEEELPQWRSSFQGWIERYDKPYGATASSSSSFSIEFQRRLAIYRDNARLVQRHNEAYERGWTTYRMSLEGPFSDLTDDEFQKLHLMEPQHCSATTHPSSGRVVISRIITDAGTAMAMDNLVDYDLPRSVDWRTQGVITPIKSQGSCGSCWTFSTTGALEAHTCIAYGNADCTHWTGLAEQQLVDCAGGPYNNHGCNGGLPSQAFEYIRYNGGIESEDSYPYTSGKNANTGGGSSNSRASPTDSSFHNSDTCVFDANKVKAKVKGVFNITSGEEEEIVAAVALVGPVSVAYQVAADFRFYHHGVYDSYNATSNTTMCKSDAQDVNHAVVVVGYGETTLTVPSSSDKKKQKQVPFYIIRNSWGNAWGMEGYFWMVRGKNMCGISACASFPIVSGPTTDAPKTTVQYLRKEQDHQDHFELNKLASVATS